MIAGNINEFAIESRICAAYANPGIRALGYFVIHISGHRFGVFRPDATLLACSFDEVERRIGRRGEHTAFFAKASSKVIAEHTYNAIYNSTNEAELIFGRSHSEFSDLVFNHHLLWAPDGDQAFDDGSFILQFDIERDVRLIGFKSDDECKVIQNSLVDLSITAGAFYSTLEVWRRDFEREWDRLTKYERGRFSDRRFWR